MKILAKTAGGAIVELDATELIALAGTPPPAEGAVVPLAEVMQVLDAAGGPGGAGLAQSLRSLAARLDNLRGEGEP